MDINISKFDSNNFNNYNNLTKKNKYENILQGQAVSTGINQKSKKYLYKVKTIRIVRQCLETPALLLIHSTTVERSKNH